MAEFEKDKLDNFLGTVRKYMQVRGGMSQKELAVLTETSVSTMSRFLSQKTGEMNPQHIAKIVAKLDIPLHEMIDFVDEDFADRFIRLVKFYKNELGEDEPSPEKESEAPKQSEEKSSKSNSSIREKLDALTPRQKAYLTDFLNLDMEGKDLMVDLGIALFRYLRQKGMQFPD